MLPNVLSLNFGLSLIHVTVKPTAECVFLLNKAFIPKFALNIVRTSFISCIIGVVKVNLIQMNSYKNRHFILIV